MCRNFGFEQNPKWWRRWTGPQCRPEERPWLHWRAHWVGHSDVPCYWSRRICTSWPLLASPECGMLLEFCTWLICPPSQKLLWSRRMLLPAADTLSVVMYLLQTTHPRSKSSLVWSEYLGDWTINAIEYHLVVYFGGYWLECDPPVIFFCGFRNQLCNSSAD